jgi:hypothetical protein
MLTCAPVIGALSFLGCSYTQRGLFGTPRGLGLATATTSESSFPHLEQRIRVASFASGTVRPAIRRSAYGSMWRDALILHAVD